jgi:hypothetical protein
MKKPVPEHILEMIRGWFGNDVLSANYEGNAVFVTVKRMETPIPYLAIDDSFKLALKFDQCSIPFRLLHARRAESRWLDKAGDITQQQFDDHMCETYGEDWKTYPEFKTLKPRGNQNGALQV